MFTIRSMPAARRSNLTRLAVYVVLLVAAAPLAMADPLAPSPADGTWKLTVTADAAAKAAGRDDFFEYVTIDGLGYTGSEIARLGFAPVTPTTGINGSGQTTFSVAMTSAGHGQWNASGYFNLAFTQMNGTLNWIKDGQTYKYNFVGVRYTPPVVEE
jgi:hypothetical protein